MSEKPILFSAPMVWAIMSGAKTQTRRPIKNLTPDPDRKLWRFGYKTHGVIFQGDDEVRGNALAHTRYLRYAKGDRLWVRETFTRDGCVEGAVAYRADGEPPQHIEAVRWRPSIFMPRWASRITLAITDVRVQRLQDISEEDAKAEGVREMRGVDGLYVGSEGPGKFVSPWATAREAFSDLWDGINGTGSWNTNPWVYAISFERADSIDDRTVITRVA